MIKKLQKKITEFLPAISIALLPNLALAADGDKVEPIKKTLPELITLISSAIAKISIPIAILFMIIGGFMYVTSSGEPENIQKAKLIILYSIIGLVFIIASWVIINFVTTSLGV